MDTGFERFDDIDAMFNEGVLSDEYEVIGLYRDGMDGLDNEFEIFIVSERSEV